MVLSPASLKMAPFCWLRVKPMALGRLMLPFVPFRCSPAPTLLLATEIVLAPVPKPLLLLIQTAPPSSVKLPVNDALAALRYRAPPPDLRRVPLPETAPPMLSVWLVATLQVWPPPKATGIEIVIGCVQLVMLIPLVPSVRVMPELLRETGLAGLVKLMPLMLKACESQLLRLPVELAL